MMHKIKRFFPVLSSNLMFLRRVVRTLSSESFHKLKLKVDPVWSHNNGSLQIKTTRSQNESELSRLLSESRLNITSGINAFLLKNERAGKLCLRTCVVMFSLFCDQLCDETFYSFIKSGKLVSRLTLDADNNISILDKSCGVEKFTSELNLAVENKFCRLLRKSHSFALNKDIKFKSNLVTENDISRLEIRKSSCDISFEIDTFRLKSRRSALENDSKDGSSNVQERQRTF